MPVTPRDGEEGVRTRRQAALDESRDQAVMAEEGTSSPTVHPAHPTATMTTSPPLDMAALLAALEKSQRRALQEIKESQEASQRRALQEIKESQEASQRQALQEIKESQEASQRQALQEIKENQSQALQEIRENQQQALEIIDSKLAGVKETIKNLQEDVDSMKPALKEVRTTLDDHETTLNTHEKMLKELQKTKALCAAPVITGGPKFKVPTFDGTTSWTAFRHQFEVVAKGNGWDDDQALTALTLALRADALLILENLPADRRTLEALFKALEARYGDKHLEHVYRAQLKERTQKSNEGLQQWATEIERLVRRAYASSTASVDDAVVQAFVDGIRDHEVRAAVRLGHHTTLDAALAHALEVEAVRSDYRTHKLLEVVAAVQPRGGPMCYGCGERGHISLSCPAKKQRRWISSATQVDATELNGARAMWRTGLHRAATLMTSQASNRDSLVTTEESKIMEKLTDMQRDNERVIKSLREKIDQLTDELNKLKRLVTSKEEVKVVKTPELVEPWNKEEVQKAQMEDKDLKPIIESKRRGRKPLWKAMSATSPITKAYWAQWDNLILEEGVLYRRWESPRDKEHTLKMVIPRSKVASVLRLVHDGNSGGHLGRRKTFEKVRERFYWVRCREDIKDWCRKCSTCASVREPRTRLRGITTPPRQYFMEMNGS